MLSRNDVPTVDISPYDGRDMLLKVIIINCKDKFKTLILQEVTVDFIGQRSKGRSQRLFYVRGQSAE